MEIEKANSSFTVMFWLNQTGLNAPNGRYLYKGSSAGGWGVRSFSGGNGIFFLLVNTSNSVISLQDMSSTDKARQVYNEWIHFTWTSDGKQYRFYRNGNFVSNMTVTRTDDIGGTATLNIGSDSFGSNGMNGSIDDFRFYNEALSQTEINQIVNNKKSPQPPYLSRIGGIIRGNLSTVNIYPLTITLYYL